MIFLLFRIQQRRLESWKRNSRKVILSTISAASNVFSDSMSIALPPPDRFISLNRRTLAKSCTVSECRIATPQKRLSPTRINCTNGAKTRNPPTFNSTAKWSAQSVISQPTLAQTSLLLSRNSHNISRIHLLFTWQKPNTSSVTSKALSTSVPTTLHHQMDQNLSQFVTLTPLMRLTPTTENHTPDISL